MTLQGEELDRAVAVQLGWEYCGSEPGWEYWIRTDGVSRRGMPECSTDPEHIPEMLEWLAARGQAVRIFIGPKGVYAGCNGVPMSFNEHKAEGKTLQEALARLVLAVAGAKR